MAEVKEVFKVDPNMRADMIEVSKLSRRVKLAEDRSAHLANLLETGISDRLAEAEETIRKNQASALTEFAVKAENAKQDAVAQMKSMQGMLTVRVSVRTAGLTTWSLRVVQCSSHLPHFVYRPPNRPRWMIWLPSTRAWAATWRNSWTTKSRRCRARS